MCDSPSVANAAVWLVATGFRLSEATALILGDIDVKNHACRINVTGKQGIGSDMVIAVSKTKTSICTRNIASHGLAVVDLQTPQTALIFLTQRISTDHTVSHPISNKRLCEYSPLPIIQSNDYYQTVTRGLMLWIHSTLKISPNSLILTIFLSRHTFNYFSHTRSLFTTK